MRDLGLLPDANHVHSGAVRGRWPARTFADLHGRYTGYVNARERTTGHLWQGRNGSVVMDEAHLFHAIRYVTLIPVRAGLVKRAMAWAMGLAMVKRPCPSGRR